MIKIIGRFSEVDNYYSILFFILGFLLVLFFSCYCGFKIGSHYFFSYFFEYFLLYLFIFFTSFIFYVFYLLKIKLNNFLFIILFSFFLLSSLFYYNTYRINEKISYHQINIEEMKRNLVTDKFRFEGVEYVLNGRTPMKYDLPIAVNVKNNKKVFLQCHLVNIKCSYVSGGRLVGGTYNVKYYITSENKNIIFKIWNIGGVNIDFSDRYTNFIISNKLDVYLYILFIVLNLFYMVNIKIRGLI